MQLNEVKQLCDEAINSFAKKEKMYKYQIGSFGIISENLSAKIIINNIKVKLARIATTEKGSFTYVDSIGDICGYLICLKKLKVQKPDINNFIGCEICSISLLNILVEGESDKCKIPRMDIVINLVTNAICNTEIYNAYKYIHFYIESILPALAKNIDNIISKNNKRWVETQIDYTKLSGDNDNNDI